MYLLNRKHLYTYYLMSSPSSFDVFEKYDANSRFGVGVRRPIYSIPLFSDLFQHCQNTREILNITLICDRCRRSSAAATPVKYVCGSKDLIDNVATSSILLTETTNGALEIPTLGDSDCWHGLKHNGVRTGRGRLCQMPWLFRDVYVV